MKNMALRARVSLFTVSIFLAALWALAWHQASNLREEFQKLLLAQQYSKVRYIANNLDEAMKARQFALATVARAITPDLLRRPRQLQAFLEAQRALGRTFSLGMYVVSATGLGLADFPVMAGRSGADYTQRDYFMATMATGKPVIGKPVLGRFAKEPVLLMAVPVLDHANRIAAVLVGANQIHGSDLFNEVQAVHSNPDGELHIISPKDRLFIASTEARRILQPIAAPGVNQLLDSYLQGYEGSGLMLNSRRIEGLSSASRMGASGWVVEAFLPTEIAFAPLRARQRDIYRDAALLSLVLALVVGLFLRWQLMPLRDTSALLHDMARGRLAHEQLPVEGAPEIRQLLESFNLLQAHLTERDEARTNSETTLRMSELKHRVLFESAGDAIFIHNAAGMLAVNPRACERLGFTQAELMTLAAGDVDAPDQLQHVPGRTARLLEQGSLTFETVHQRKDGSLVPTEVSASCITWDGEPAILSVCRDLTERKLAETALRDAHQFNEQIIQGAQEGIIVYDRELRYRVWNPFMEQLTGLPASAVLGKHPLELFPFLQDVGGQDARDRALAGEASESADFHFQIAETGKTGWSNETISPLRDAQGEINGVIVLVRDVTARILAKEERRKLQAQLLQAQKMESLGSLAGGVAHDMNNVLGAILGMASANIEAHPAGSPTFHAFEIIVKAATRGGKMVKNLLGFARQSPYEESELDVNEILREEVRMLERTTLAKVQLELDLAPILRPIRGDASALTHAFMNLCVNAVDAMPESGTLTLRTRDVDNAWIEVLVEDTGTGMPQEVLKKALDPFFTTKAQGKGTGLGLAMVYSTVKAHRGQLQIQSEPGHGTQVRMRFPTSEPMPLVPGPAATPRLQSSHRALSVLVVDDDELIQFSMLTLLETLGHLATGVSCGEDALAKLEAGFQADAVILDMNMPGLGGAGTLPRLRALNPTVPILLATGRVDELAMALAGAHPRVTLLAKPYSLGVLQQHLDTLERVQW